MNLPSDIPHSNPYAPGSFILSGAFVKRTNPKSLGVYLSKIIYHAVVNRNASCLKIFAFGKNPKIL